DLEVSGIGLRRAAGEEYLAAWNAERQYHGAGRGFPQPEAHLVVERLHLARFHDVGVVPQAVEELRAVGLAVDRFELVVLDERVVLGPFDDRMLVGAARSLPDPGQRSERPEVGQSVGVAIRFGVDVGAVRFAGDTHASSLVCAFLSVAMKTAANRAASPGTCP